ncbi:MAG: zinc metalloprotease HtpX [Candidatus Woesearchaeota archaeon]|nr:MAG: zinc metalloprotease HtpX [Candidatus Woesearchaeota archaeon]
MWNQIKTVLLLGILTAILLFIGSFFGRVGLTIALIFVLGMNLITYFFSDKIALMIYRANEIKKDDKKWLHDLVNEVAKKAGIPKPKGIYLIPTQTPNAFCTGRSKNHYVVAYTQGILDLLNKEELKGVTAHEVSHAKNRDILVTTIAATIAGVISYLASMARWGAIFGGSNDRNSSANIVGLLILSILAPLAAVVIQLAISRSREYLADSTGAKTIQNSEALASALVKLHSGVKNHPMTFGNPTYSSLFIVNPFSARGLINLFMTHPPMEERVKRLKAMKF